MNFLELKVNPSNPRQIKKEQFEKLKKSIGSFTKMLEVRPIAYDEDGVIWGGNMRFEAIKALGIEMKPEYFKELTGYTLEEKREFAIRDNVELGEWDDDILANEWSDLPLDDWGVDVSGWDEEVVEDEAPELSDEVVSKLGEVYQLGRHRLLCGDSTKIEDVEKLMNGQKADMVFTDPPYNVGYDYTVTYTEGRRKRTPYKAFDDSKSDVAFYEFLRDVFSNLFTNTKLEGAFYCWYATMNEHVVRASLVDSGWLVSQTLYWLKDRPTFSKGLDYLWITEPCYFGWHKGNKHFYNRKYRGDFNNIISLEYEDYNQLMNVLYEERENQMDYEHPTQKPCRLAERAINRHCPRGGSVVDAFGGSGSTLIACEQLDRTCYISEIDSKYVDVIIKRWVKFTGQRAYRIIDAEGKQVKELVQFADESFMESKK